MTNTRLLIPSSARARTRGLGAAVLAVLFTLAACSDDPASDSEAADEVSALVGKRGGMLKSKGVTVVIPEDALDKEVTITVKNKGFAAPSKLKVKQASDVFEFGPAGTKFKKDVEMQFHTDKDDEKAGVYFTKENSDEFARIDSEKKPGASGKGPDLVAKIDHFSQGFVGIPEADELDGGVVGPDRSAELDGGNDSSLEEDAAALTKHIVVFSKDTYGLAVNQTWAAFQDGDGAWQALAPSTTVGTYEFEVKSERYGVVLVCSSKDTPESSGHLHFAPATTSVLEVPAVGEACTAGTAPMTFNMSGSITSGVGQTRYSNGHTSTEFASNTSYNVGFFNAGEPTDLLLGTSTDAVGGLSRVVVKRDLTLAGDVTGANIDFIKAADSYDVSSASALAAVLNASAQTTVKVLYTTRGANEGLSLNQEAPKGTTVLAMAFAILPEVARRPTDLYVLSAQEDLPPHWRTASSSSYPSGDLNVTMLDPFDVTFGSVDAPFFCPTYAFTDRPEATSYLLTVAYSELRAVAHEFETIVDPAWFEDDATHSVTFPDLSQVAGFQANWLPPSVLGSLRVDLSASVRSQSAGPAGSVNREAGLRKAILPPQ